MTRTTLALASLALPVLAGPALAHPGHPAAGPAAEPAAALLQGLAHPFGGPDHLLLLLGLGALTALARHRPARLAALAAAPLVALHALGHGIAALGPAYLAGFLVGSLALLGLGAGLGRATGRLVPAPAARFAGAALAATGALGLLLG